MRITWGSHSRPGLMMISHARLNRHQTILRNFFNFSSIERYHACHISCKQISNEQKSQICVKCVIWKQIHEKWESVITQSWPTFSNGRVRHWAGPSYQPPSATEWPHYIMTNWPQVVPQKAHRCEDKQKSLTSHSSLGRHLCKSQIWGFYLSCWVHVSVVSFGWNAILCHIILVVSDAVRIVEPSPD